MSGSQVEVKVGSQVEIKVVSEASRSLGEVVSYCVADVESPSRIASFSSYYYHYYQ